MKKYYSLIILLFINASCMTKHYVEFIPISFVNEKFIEQPSSPGFYPNLQKVLDFYDEDYSVNENGIVLVPSALRQDKDLCWNYTRKARDSSWLRQHAK